MVSVIAAFINFYLVAAVLVLMGVEEESVVIVIALLPVAIFGCIFYIRMRSPRDTTLADSVAHISHSASNERGKVRAQRLNEECLEAYASAEEEIDSGSFDRGLWLKALIEANGDEGKRSVEYRKLRALQIQHDTIRSRSNT